MSFFAPQNPGIGGLDELTNAEELFLTSFASLSFQLGDTIFFDGGNLINGNKDVSKTFTYNVDGTLNVITDSRGTKTMVWSGGVLTGVIGTGYYKTKTFSYTDGALTSITVS